MLNKPIIYIPLIIIALSFTALCNLNIQENPQVANLATAISTPQPWPCSLVFLSLPFFRISSLCCLFLHHFFSRLTASCRPSFRPCLGHPPLSTWVLSPRLPFLSLLLNHFLSSDNDPCSTSAAKLPNLRQ